MLPTPARLVRWMGVLSILVANLTFAQSRSNEQRPSEDPLRNAAPLTAADPVRLAVASAVRPPNTSDSWTGSAGDNQWGTAGNWSAGVPNSSTVDVTIGTTTASVNDNLSASVGNLTLSHAADGLTIANNVILSVFGSAINNAGTITLGSTGNNTELVLQGNVTLSGGGGVTLSNSAGNSISGAATKDTLTNQETISGAGSIGGAFGVLTLVNSGTINANKSVGMTIQAKGGATNTGTIEATGGPLTLSNTTLTNTGGTISATGNTLSLTNSTINGGKVTLAGASTLQMNNSMIHGGSTLTNSATGTIEVLPGFASTLGGTINNSAGGAFKIDNNATLKLEAGTYSQLGTVQLNSTGNNTELVLLGNVTLSGGTVTLSNNTGNIIVGSTSTNVLTNQETIQGAGSIGGNFGTIGLINSGTINANQSAGLVIHPGTAGFTNTGTLQVSGGDLMHVTGGPFTNFSGSTLTGGTYNVSGTLQIDQLGTAGGEIVTNASKIILNGAGSTFVDSASKDALANLNSNTAAGAFTVSGGRNFTTAGNFNNLGSLTVGTGSGFTVTGTLAQISGSTLSGGTFVLGGNLNVGSGINLTTNSSTLTLEGGTIMSGATNALAGLNKNTKSLTLANSANFTTTGNFTNSGAMTINSGSTFGVTGTLTNLSAGTLTGGTYTIGGTMQLASANGGINTNAANLTLTGTTAKILDGTSNALAGFNNNREFWVCSGS